MLFSLSSLKTHYLHRIEKHVLKFIVTYSDSSFYFLEKNNDASPRKKFIMYLLTENE